MRRRRRGGEEGVLGTAVVGVGAAASGDAAAACFPA